MNFFGKIKRIRFQDDLAKAKKNIKEVSIHGDVKNIESIENLLSLRKVYLVTVSQEQFDKILPFLSNVTDLKIYEIRCTDLSSLGSLHSLENLDLDWNTKIETLWNMGELTSLSSLSINDFSKLNDISNISKMPWLTNLSLTGGMWNKLSLKSIEPLSVLKELRSLDLGNIEIKDSNSILPLSSLVQLEKLNIPNRFPTEEIARLSVKLPNTVCDFFTPFIKVNSGDDKDTLIIGKGKPRLNSKKDSERIKKYEAEFLGFQNKYR
jgi:Leucine-rich repeat (LRR) protein